jgi:ribosomal protein S18 acetylase RimI-like enzyme/mannose-6-phosphate isomerase-like protein (cupin superfamily)
MVRIIPSPRIIPAAGYPPKQIAEFIGREISGTSRLSVAMMKSPPGWAEPGQAPEFDEYSLVLSGSLVVTTRSGEYSVTEGQAVMVPAGEWIRYSSPQGAEYIAICLPAFSPDLVHRDDESGTTDSEGSEGIQPVLFEERGIEGLTMIEDLWNQLRDHHAGNTRFFRDQLLSRSFSERYEEILKSNENRHLLVQIARSDSSRRPVGFCVSSAAPGSYGEIESVFIESAFRSRGIGTHFMKRACSWMKQNGVRKMVIGVCEGNEESFRFYQRFGFYLRRHYLERKEN